MSLLLDCAVESRKQLILMGVIYCKSVTSFAGRQAWSLQKGLVTGQAASIHAFIPTHVPVSESKGNECSLWWSQQGVFCTVPLCWRGEILKISDLSLAQTGNPVDLIL